MDRPPIDPILLRLLIHVAFHRIRRLHLSDAAPEDQPVEASNRVPPPPPSGPSFLRLLLRLPLHQIRRILPPDAEPTDQLVEANSVVPPPPLSTTDPSLLHFVLHVALHRILARRATATSWRHYRLSMTARAGPSHLRFALHHALRWMRRLPMATAALSGDLMAPPLMRTTRTAPPLRLPLHQIRRILPPDAEPTDQLVEAYNVVLPQPSTTTRTDPSLLHFVLHVAPHRILARRSTATSWPHCRGSMTARAGPSLLRFALHLIRRLPMATAALDGALMAPPTTRTARRAPSLLRFVLYLAMHRIRRIRATGATLDGALMVPPLPRPAVVALFIFRRRLRRQRMVIASGPLQSLHLTAADTFRFIRRMALHDIHDFLPSPMVTNNRQVRQLLRLLCRHLPCSHITREMFALWTIFCCVCVTFEYFTTRTVDLQTTTDSSEVVSHVGTEEVSVANCGMPLAVVDDPVHVERSTAVMKNVKKVVSSFEEAESAISEWEADKAAVIAVDVPADTSLDTAPLIGQYFRKKGADVLLQGSTITSMLQRVDEPQVELSGSESSMGPLKVSVEKPYQTVCSPLHSPDRHVDK